MRQSVLHTSFNSVLCAFALMGSTIDSRFCCGETRRPVVYQSESSSIRLADGTTLHATDSVELVDFDSNSTGSSMIVLLDEGRPPERSSVFLRSHDDGHTWNHLAGEIPSRLGLKGYPLSRSVSDADVLYLQVEGLLLYLRSRDGGKSWDLPAYRVDGASRDDLARRIAGRPGYRLWAELAGISPNDPNVIYGTFSVVPWAAPLGGGLLPVYAVPGMYSSQNGGETWTKLTDDLKDSSVLGFSPRNPRILFGEGPGGLVRSQDGGKTWVPLGKIPLEADQPSNVNPPPRLRFEVKQFVIGPSDEQSVFVVSNLGVHRSADGGKTWCLLNLGFHLIDSVNALAISPRDPNFLVVSTKYGLFLSRDKGCSFNRIVVKAI